MTVVTIGSFLGASVSGTGSQVKISCIRTSNLVSGDLVTFLSASYIHDYKKPFHHQHSCSGMRSRKYPVWYGLC